MKLILIEIGLKTVLQWLTNADQATTFSVTDTELYVPVVTVSTQHSAKPLEQLKSGFKKTINWNKY